MNYMKNAFIKRIYGWLLREERILAIEQIFVRDYIVDKRMMALDWNRDWNIISMGEYIRTSSLELIAKEIYEKNISGSVAELGVWRGEFASRINCSFPDRKIYLFDTFEGFDVRDAEIERVRQYSTAQQDFSQTSIDLVLGKMPYKQKCIIKKGYFPNSLEGLEDHFCFVSIDADLFQPTYEGLRYFYPRLTDGGYIFIHDYNNMEYKGVKEAVRLFSGEMQISYFPLSDPYGTAVICKP